MAKNQTRPLSESILSEDKDSFAALKKVQGYAPVNPNCTVNKLQTAHDAMAEALEAAAQAKADWEATEDDSIAAQWGFHNLILDAKDQVKAQFGSDSNEVQAVGLKKKSDYKSPKRKKKDEKSS